MSTISSETLISKFPQERDTIQRLLDVLNDNEGTTRLKEYTLKRLFDLTSPRSELVLTQALNYLVKGGVLRRVIRVESPNQGGLKDFSSLMDVPDKIHDWRRDMEMNVTPDDINVLYQVVSNLSNNSRINGY
jgi:hypothetical protein